MPPTFFKTPFSFRTWLRKNHQKKTELIVGYYKVGSGESSITWSESVDEALCFGWIDGVRTSIDEHSYQIRFTPRKPGSTWSAINIKKMEMLVKEGRMEPAGLACFNDRKQDRTGLYAHEKNEVRLSAGFEKLFRADKKAWAYFKELAPSYKKISINWVMGAKQEATRLKRLQQLLDESRAGTNQWKDNKYRPRKGSST